jgi:hypothetical protein
MPTAIYSGVLAANTGFADAALTMPNATGSCRLGLSRANIMLAEADIQRAQIGLQPGVLDGNDVRRTV